MFWVISCWALKLSAQQKLVYYSDESDTLTILFYPLPKQQQKTPAIVLFHGGGWYSRNQRQMEVYVPFFHSLGYSVFLPTYRLAQMNEKPLPAVKDAAAALNFIRKNKRRHHVDLKRLVVGGSSAGGHLALCTQLSSLFYKTESMKRPPRAKALVLFNPVVDIGKHGYGFERWGAHSELLNPLKQLHSDLAPTLILHGRSDETVKADNIIRFKARADSLGVNCSVEWFEGRPHGFANYNNGEPPAEIEKIRAAIRSLLNRQTIRNR